MRVVKRSDTEIDELMNDVNSRIDEGRRKFPGMTYEEGIRAVVDWLFGDSDDHPMAD